MEKYRFLFRPLVAVVGIAIIIASFLFTRDVVISLAMEEHGKMKLWAAATEQLIRADMDCDVTLEQGVITNNTTIPVILTDSLYNVLSYKNIDINNPTSEELRSLAIKFAQQHEPIKVDVGYDDVQYICYGNSILYKKLFLFPIVQFLVIALFVVLIVLAIRLMKSSEQNKLSLSNLEHFKETACGMGLRKVIKYLHKLDKVTKDPETRLIRMLLETEYANLSAKQHNGRLKGVIYERKAILLFQMADLLEEMGWNYGINEETGKNASYLVYVYLPNGVQLTWHCNEYAIYDSYPQSDAQWDGQVCMTMEKILTYINNRYFENLMAA